MGFSILYNLDRTYFWSSEQASQHVIRRSSDSSGYIHSVSSGFVGSYWSQATTGVTSGTSYTANYYRTAADAWYGSASFTASAITGSLTQTTNCVTLTPTSSSIKVTLKGFGFFNKDSGSYPNITVKCSNGSSLTYTVYQWMTIGYTFSGLSADTSYTFTVTLDSPGYTIGTFTGTTSAEFVGMTLFYNNDFAFMYTDSAVKKMQLYDAYGGYVINKSFSTATQWGTSTYYSSGSEGGLSSGYTYYGRNAVNSTYGSAVSFTAASSGSSSTMINATAATTSIAVKLRNCVLKSLSGSGGYPNITVKLKNSSGTTLSSKTYSYDDWNSTGYTFTGLTAGTTYYFDVTVTSPGVTVLSNYAVTTYATFVGMTVFYNRSFAVMYSDSAVYAHNLYRSTGTTVISKTSTSSSFQWSSNTSAGLVASGTYYGRTANNASLNYSDTGSFTASSSITLSSAMIGTTVSGTSVLVKLSGCALAKMSSSGTWPSIKVTLTYNGTSTPYTMNYDEWNSTGHTFTGLTNGATYTITVVVDTPNVTIATGSVKIEDNDIGFWIYNGSSWVKATPYIYNGSSWVQAVPCVYSGGWITGS